MDSLHKNEAKLEHDLHSGNAIHASISLQNEFDRNPKEALAIVQRELQRAGNASHHDKDYIKVAANGDVFVQDKDCGYFAGTIPQGMRDQVSQSQPARQPAVEAAPAAYLPAVPAEQVVQTEPGAQPYEYQQPRHPGFHVPFPIEIGVHNGSLQIGVNALGLVKGGITLGAQNRGYVGSDVAQTEVSAGVDLNSDHIGPAADWKVLNGNVTRGSARVGIDPTESGADVGAEVDASALAGTIGTGGHAGVEVGRRVGPHVNGYGYVGPAGASADGYGNLSDRGIQAGADADVSVQPVVGVQGKGRVGLGTRNEAHADLGANVGDNGISAGAGLYPQLHPDIYGRGYSGSNQAGVGLNPARAWSRNRDTSPNQPTELEIGGLY